MIKKRLCRSLIAVTVLSTLVVTPVSATSLEEKKAAAESEVSSLKSQLTEMMTKINDLEVKLTETGEEIIQAQSDLEVAQEKEEAQYEAMKLRIKYMYEDGDTAAIEKIITSGSFSEMLEQVEYASSIHNYDRDALNEYQATKNEIATLKTTLETEMTELQKTESEYTSQQEELNTTLASKEAEVADLDDQIQEAARAALEAQQREEAARQAAAQQAANNNSNSGGGSSSNNSSSNSSSNNSGSSASDYNPVTGNAIVDRAYSQMGKPYQWGAVGPDSFDCSGLVSYAVTGSFSRLGTTYTFLTYPRVSNPQPGDICVNANHCGIYIGGGQMIHAPQTGDVVKIGSVRSNMIYVRY